ncbi:unnamed protein product, partial [Sphacelaria rigidula]
MGANERLGRTLAGVVRCMLSDSGLPHFLRGELMQTATYLINRVPHSALNDETPFKALYAKEAYVGHFRTVGARAFVHVETHTKKLEPRAWEGRLVGYSMDSESSRIYNPETRKVRESRNVVFIETPPHEDLVRDVRNYTSSLDLSLSSENRETDDISVNQILDLI